MNYEGPKENDIPTFEVEMKTQWKKVRGAETSVSS